MEVNILEAFAATQFRVHVRLAEVFSGINHPIVLLMAVNVCVAL